MAISKASARWESGLKDGKGVMKPAHGGEIGYSAGTRFEGAPGSNPEELIGAALAGCFSMALAADLGRQGLASKVVRTTADVRLEKTDAGFTITGITLRCEAEVPGLDDARFQEIAAGTKKGCPVSRALAAVDIQLEARLVG